jgi:predicted RNA binding protein YcfA (HicA-like mRNA interferase family)
MKRKELIKRISSAGCVLVRHGTRHDLYRNPKTGKK